MAGLPLNTLKVSYLGTNVGKIYLSDIGKRLGLGGAQEGNYTYGQDEYIMWGEVKVFDLVGEVVSSISSGIIAHFSNATNPSWSALNGAPLTLDVGAHTVLEAVPSQIFMTGTGGGTGTNFEWSDEYLALLANDKYAPTTTAGATGYYYGNAI
jgi:hypothetical protein